MDKKVLILSSSPRKGGNSETLAAAFAKGAQEAGNQVETVVLREKRYGFCKGCLACQKLGHCVIKDDAVEIADKMHDADVLVFVTPVYYYSVSGQLKTMLDLPIRCSAQTMLSRRLTCWRRRRRTDRKPWRAAKRPCGTGWTASLAVNGREPYLPAV